MLYMSLPYFSKGESGGFFKKGHMNQHEKYHSVPSIPISHRETRDKSPEKPKVNPLEKRH